MGAPVGPTGCNAARGEAEPRATSGLQVSAVHGRSWSHLHFEDGSEPVLEQQTAVGTLAYFFENGWSVALSGGVVFAGSVDGGEFGPGWLVSGRVAWRWLEQRGPVPFVVTSLTVSVSRSEIGIGSGWYVLGTDFRVGFTVGYTLFDVLRVYVSPRVFGGPIYIEGLRGRDRFFFQVGIGMALLMPAGLTLFFDGSPGGEKALSGGLAYSF